MSSECRVQSSVSRQKQLITVSAVANAQKQGVAEVECIEASDTTMFQELVHNAKCKINRKQKTSRTGGFFHENHSFL